MQEVTFDSSGLSIDGILAMPNIPGPVPGVIIFHGMTSSGNNYATLTQGLAEQGIAGLAISMRGHGKSEGDFERSTVAEAVSDAIAAYDFLCKQTGVNGERIGMVGSSVGAILASMAAEQRSVSSIAFRAPAAYTPEMMQISMSATMVNEERQFHNIDNLENTPAGKAIGNFEGSLLVVASEKDSIIPLSISQGYIEVADKTKKKQLITIKGASHTLTQPEWKDTFQRAILNWFSETL